MRREFTIGDEPVPGYRLAAVLGEGAFGKVWRATGPGDTEVALKIIRTDRKRWRKEFDSIRMVKGIRAANLVDIVGIWLIDDDGVPLDDASVELLTAVVGGPSSLELATGKTAVFNATRAEFLVVAMGLGEKSLADLLDEYRLNGQPGIPVETLLDYMEDAAKALDYLNEPRHNLPGKERLQSVFHCDIKPGNIMLVGNAAKVCDLGLAKTGDIRTTAALTPAYGAPELYDSKPTRGTDQYSLAITYYELRTGVLPFASDIARSDLERVHRESRFDFSRVPAAEQAVLRRATIRHPEERYETCLGMIRELRRARQEKRSSGREPTIFPQIGGLPLKRGYELTPGYLLSEHLFHPDSRTDVWMAVDRKDKHFSLWIYDLANLPGAVDLDALRFARQIDHPHVTRLFDWWVLDEAGDDVTASFSGFTHTDPSAAYLVIASELARVTLAQKVYERRESKGFGMPAEQALDYVRQAAKAIEALNMPVHGPRNVRLVHTDVRPHNLLVVDNELKLGNLAWCRVLEGDSAEIDGLEARPFRTTLAPEVGEGRLDRRSDQYSLAACYSQMRSGKIVLESALPSATTELSELTDVGLTELWADERPVVEQAMNRTPSLRFRTCANLIEALEHALEIASPAPPPVPEVDLLRTLVPGPSPPSPNRETQPTVRGGTTEPEPGPPRRRLGRFVAAAMWLLASGAAAAFFVPDVRNKVASILTAPAVSPDDTGDLSSPTVSTTVPERTDAPEDYKSFLEAAEYALCGENISDAAKALAGAKRVLETQKDSSASAWPKLKLLDAWLAFLQKEPDWPSTIRARLDEIAPAKLSAPDLWRCYVLSALAAAAFNPSARERSFGQDADLKAIADAIDKVRQNGGWKQADHSGEPLREAMRSLVEAAVTLAYDEVKSENYAHSRLALSGFSSDDLADFNDVDDVATVQIPFRVTEVCLLLTDSERTWSNISPAWAGLTKYPRTKLADDAELIGLRLLDWAEGHQTDHQALGKAIEAYQTLGLLPANKNYARLLAEWIEYLASCEDPNWETLGARCPLWETIKSQCDALETEAKKLQATEFDRKYFADLCLIESTLEDKAPNAAKNAMRSLPDRKPKISESEPADEGYFDYVTLAVQEANNQPFDRDQVDRLCRAYEAKPVNHLLATKPRQHRAAKIMVKAARDLGTKSGTDAVTFATADGDEAFRWLNQAKALDAKTANAVEGFEILLAAASLDKTKPEAPQLLPADEAMPLEKRRVILGLNARAAEQRSSTADAIHYYAELLRLLDFTPGKTDLAMVYSTVVKRALKLAGGVSEAPPPIQSDIAYVYATKGKLLRLDPAVDLEVFKESDGQVWGSHAVFDCYDKAIEHDKSDYNYYLQRGIARYNSAAGDDEALIETLHTADMEPAKQKGGEHEPAFTGLEAVICRLQAHLQMGIEELPKRIVLYEDAAEKARNAAAGCQDADRAEFLRLESMARLELANCARKPTAAIRECLQEAVAAATEAIDAHVGSHPEYSYQAKGNAEEDFGLLLGDLDGYRKSLITFQQMGEKGAKTNDAVQNESLICLGRAKWRLAFASSPANPDPELCAQALKHLHDAAESRIGELKRLEAAGNGAGPSAAIIRARIAEAYYWQAMVHSRQLTAKSKDALLAMQNCMKFSARGSEAWPTHQLTLAVLSDSSDFRESARQILESAGSRTDGELRAKALAAIFGTYISQGSQGDRLVGEVEAGLKEYRKYLPLDHLDDASHRDLYALIDLSELLAGRARAVWRKYKPLCDQVSARAIALAETLDVPYLTARASHARALHENNVGVDSSDGAALRRTVALEKKAIALDDALDDAALSWVERSTLRSTYAFNCRYTYANASFLIAHKMQPGPQRTQLCDDALRVLRKGVPPSKTWKDAAAELEGALLRLR